MTQLRLAGPSEPLAWASVPECRFEDVRLYLAGADEFWVVYQFLTAYGSVGDSKVPAWND